MKQKEKLTHAPFVLAEVVDPETVLDGVRRFGVGHSTALSHKPLGTERRRERCRERKGGRERKREDRQAHTHAQKISRAQAEHKHRWLSFFSHLLSLFPSGASPLQRTRKTKRQRDRETEKQRDRQTDRDRDRETERQREGKLTANTKNSPRDTSTVARCVKLGSGPPCMQERK
jgi:hypothetical protein